MSDHIDVFRVDTRGVLWLESAPSIERATVRVQELAADLPGGWRKGLRNLSDRDPRGRVELNGDCCDHQSIAGRRL